MSPMSSPSSLLDSANTAQLNSWMNQIVLRPAGPEDRRALEALAALDSAADLAHPVLMLEEDGHLRAARSLHDGAMISDPFALTAHLCRLLSTHAAASTRRGRRARVLPPPDAVPEAHRARGRL